MIREILLASESVPEDSILFLPRLRPPYETVHTNRAVVDAYLRLVRDVPREFGVISGLGEAGR